MSAISDIEEIQALLQPRYPNVVVDGDIGKITTAAVRNVGEQADAKLGAAIQTILARRRHVEVDGWIGRLSMEALAHLDEEGDIEALTDFKPELGPLHTVKTSSFADPADVRAFKSCKAKGGSDQTCFKTGDNGIGKWGHFTAQELEPMVALPREVWREAGKIGGAKVIVMYHGRNLNAILGDTMPSIANIKNGAGMDTNPAVAKFFGLKPPYMVEMSWRWG